MTPLPNPHDLLPLELAARTIQKRAYPEQFLPMVVAGNEHLNGLAYAIAALVPIYTLGDGGEVRAITAEELRHGYFRAGAKELHFLDGRASVDSLAVTPDGVEKVVSSILAAKEAR